MRGRSPTDRWRFGAVLVCLGLAVAAPARADGDHDETPRSAGYFLDGGALVVYGAFLGYAGASLLMEPPDEPRLFDPGEGGAQYRGDTVPNFALSVLGGLGFGAVVATPTEARWYHVKGFAGALGTTFLLTELSKQTFGRHRPDYQPDDPIAGASSGQRSFFSGHSSTTLVTMTYLGLYLHQHVFSRWRPADAPVTWWELAGHAGLATIAVYVPLSRVNDNRHHLSDVLTGSLVGMSVAAGFYAWQERRFRRHQSARRPGRELLLMPSSEPLGVSLSLRY